MYILSQLYLVNIKHAIFSTQFLLNDVLGHKWHSE